MPTVPEPGPPVNTHADPARVAELHQAVLAAQEAVDDLREHLRSAKTDLRIAMGRRERYLTLGDTEPLLAGVPPLNGETHAEDERPREGRGRSAESEGGAAAQPGQPDDRTGHPQQAEPDRPAEHDGGGAAAADRPGEGGEGGNPEAELEALGLLTVPAGPDAKATAARQKRAEREAAANPGAVGQDARDVGRHTALSEFAGVTPRMAGLLDGSGLRTVGDLLDRATVHVHGTIELGGLLATVPGLTAKARQALTAACQTAHDARHIDIGARVRRRDEGEGGRCGWVKGTKKEPDPTGAMRFGQRATEAYVEWDLLPGETKQGAGYWRVGDLVLVARAGSPEARAEAQRAEPSAACDCGADRTGPSAEAHDPGCASLAAPEKVQTPSAQSEVKPKKTKAKSNGSVSVKGTSAPCAAGCGAVVVGGGRCAACQRDLAERGRCKVCGCTPDDCRLCVERTGEPCSWADGTQTLCTACETLAKQGLRHLSGLPTKMVDRLVKAGYATVGDVAGKRPEDLAGVKAGDALQVCAEVERWLTKRLAERRSPDPTDPEFGDHDKGACAVCTGSGEIRSPAAVEEAVEDLDGSDMDLLLPFAALPEPLQAVFRREHGLRDGQLVCVGCAAKWKDAEASKRKGKKEASAK